MAITAEASLVTVSESAEQESAASRALRIPHILSAIFGYTSRHYEHAEPNWTLLACTLVNSLFEKEANRLLWEQCDYDELYFPHTTLQYLVKIKPSSRRQKYANYVRKIKLTAYYNRSTDPECYGGFDNQIRKVSFPCLENLKISLPGSSNDPSAPLLSLAQFAQPRLRSLAISLNTESSWTMLEDFLRYAQHMSPGIKEIAFRQAQMWIWDGWTGLQVTSFLDTYRSLESISWNVGESTISEADFMALCRCTRLKTINIHSIQDSWVEGTLPETAFAALTDLNCRISGRALENLAPFLVSIVTLNLQDMVPSISKIWKVIANARLKHLTSLSVYVKPDSVLYAEDLLSIAHNHPQLETLKFAGWTDEYGCLPFVAKNFSDRTIEDLAKRLPMLTALDLKCTGDVDFFLTQDSLISLGQYCPHLSWCSLYMLIDWEILVKNESVEKWPKLEVFQCYPLAWERTEPYQEEDECYDADELAKEVMQHMPVLGGMSFGMVYLGEAKRLQRALEQRHNEKHYGVWDISF